MSGYLESLSKSELQAIIDLGKAAERVMANKGHSVGSATGGSLGSTQLGGSSQSQFADGGRETQR
ncbi:hypothetical protein KFS98_003599 [Salmonella enterica]|nr:hypothetical protein [Salmonella enterica]